MTIYRLNVLQNGKQVARGTAWLASPDRIVTAFHVVGDGEGPDAAWLSDRLEGVEYRLADGGLAATPEMADPQADLALLRLAGEAKTSAIRLADGVKVCPDARWRASGYPAFHDGPFTLSGTLTAVSEARTGQALQVLVEQGTQVNWEGVSGSPVLIGDAAAGVVTSMTGGADTGWAASRDALAALLRLAGGVELAERCRALLGELYSEVRDLEHLTEDHLNVTLSAEDATTVGAAARWISERFWRGGSEAFLELLHGVEQDRPDVDQVKQLMDELRRRRDPETVPTRPSRLDLVRKVIQELGRDIPGVALLEPVGFGARQVLDRVVEEVNKPKRRWLAIRLVPDRRTDNEERLYGRLLRDLHRGFEKDGRLLGYEAWFPDAETEIDEDAFQHTLERLLAGPVEDQGFTLNVVVEGLSRVADDHLLSWAQLISRLVAGSYPFKVLVWGGQELDELCAGNPDPEFSPFQRLENISIGPLNAQEVRELVAKRGGDRAAADAFFRVTKGHPTLVDELLDRARAELLAADEDGLRAWAFTLSHPRRLRRQIEKDAAARETLARFTGGDLARRYEDGEDRLSWLGIVDEDGPKAWAWTAAVWKEWAETWL